MVLAAIVCCCACPSVSAEPLWQQLMPRKQVAADPSADYTLQAEQGPWLILAASFSGEQGKKQAHDLVLDLRKNHGLNAYYWGMTFKLSEANLGRGVDAHGAPIRRRYKQDSQKVEHAVLVNEFPTVDDPEAQRLLEKIKQLEPESLAPVDGKQSAQSLATVRQFHNYIRQKMGKKSTKGPLGHAFVVRNPLLPRDYFVPQSIDPEIAKWNQGLDHSLLKCPGRYSIKVATFRGRSSFQGAGDEKQPAGTRKAADDDPLVVGARNAHLLAVALREKGWEAYEFHDRHESYVTVGSFDQVERQQIDGRVSPTREVQIIINTFGAKSANNIFGKASTETKLQEQRRKQQFQRMMSKNRGQVMQGFHPKSFVGIPFDIQPQAVKVPRRSISADYARN